MEDGVVFDVADKIVERLRLNMKSAAKVFGVVNSPVVEKMELGRFWYGWCRVDWPWSGSVQVQHFWRRT